MIVTRGSNDVVSRSALTFLCGIYVYGVTWILLGQSNEETLSPNVWKQFMNTNLTFASFHFSLFVATFLVFPVVPIVSPRCVSPGR